MKRTLTFLAKVEVEVDTELDIEFVASCLGRTIHDHIATMIHGNITVTPYAQTLIH